MRQSRHPENVQEQVQLPKARVFIPRGPPAESVPMPRVPERVLAAWQDEEPHENRSRLFYAQRLRLSTDPGQLLHAANRLIPKPLGTPTPDAEIKLNHTFGATKHVISPFLYIAKFLMLKQTHASLVKSFFFWAFTWHRN